MAAREQALAQREAEVRRREVALTRGGGAGVDPMLIKNFPPCCPIVHHDIANDIPDFNKNITRAYAATPAVYPSHCNAYMMYRSMFTHRFPLLVMPVIARLSTHTPQ